MRKYLMTTMLVATLGSTFLMIGCDRTVSETTKTSTSPNGDQSTSQQKTVEHPDGSVSTTTEKKSSTANP